MIILDSLPITNKFQNFIESQENSCWLILGNCSDALKQIPDSSIDCIITSPPYWGKREYDNGGIGLEKNYHEYIQSIIEICKELYRVLKPTGSFWLNLGDSYKNKNLIGIPWRIAFELTDNQGWILRNDIIWDKVKGGMDNTKDRLGNVYEHMFHFVKKSKNYYYDVDKIRSKPRTAKIINGSVISATGVSGVKYRRQIELSTSLNNFEKEQAIIALNSILNDVKNGKLSDFRMIIRNQQRVTHSEQTIVSGRAKELKEKGFYFLKYHPNGSKPSDLWQIIPEDTQNRKNHFAAYPEELCRIPLLASCPPHGIVLDPFCGTGTTLVAAKRLGFRAIGLEISEKYIHLAKKRIEEMSYEK